MKNCSITLCAAAALALTACSGLSDEAKEMVGDYYITEISPDEPMMELKGNGKCIVHAVKPGVLSYRVPGRWNVVNDSLVLTLKPAKMTFEGDSTLIGEIPEHMAKKVAEFNGTRLTLQLDGVNYVYDRRGHKD